MPWWLILGVVIAAVAVLAAIVSRAMNRRDVTASHYVANPFLFSSAERSFLGALDLAIDGRYRVFGKVRVADVVAVGRAVGPRQRQGAFNRISAKHFDFVLCTKDELRIVGVVELDDRSHRAKRRRERDSFLERVCGSISLPLIRIPAQRTYSPEALRSALVVLAPQKGNAAPAGERTASLDPQVSAPRTGAIASPDKKPLPCESTTS